MEGEPNGDDRLEQLDYYTLLGIDDSARTADVKRAFRRFARRYHPDRFVGAPEAKVARATAIYRRGSEAVQVLADPEARATYDTLLARGVLRLSAEAQEAARMEQRKAERSAEGPDGLPIRSPQAQAYYLRAADEARGGDFRAAWTSLCTALDLEPGNPLILARLDQVAARIRRR